MSRVLLVPKANHAEAYSLACTIQNWLTERAKEAVLVTDTRDGRLFRECAKGAGLVCVLGGDGTFIGVARRLIGLHVPLVGINFGRLGFLTQVQADSWQAILLQYLDGRLSVRPRLALAWELEREGRIVASGHAVNDVVLGRGSLARVISLQLVLTEGSDRQEIGWLRSDGLIVSTPQGSSAYSLSSRGPLVHPSLSCLLVTAISPFLNSLPPLVLSGESVVSLGVEPLAQDVHLTVDGQESLPAQGEDWLRVRAVPDGVYSVCPGEDTYFRTLCRRGFIREFIPDGQ